MEWKDEAIVLGTRKHGENSVILSLFTRERGRHSGLVRGAFSKKNRGALQAGNKLSVVWRGRLEEHLGNFQVELLESNAAHLITDPGKLAALSTACVMVEFGFPEREPHPELFDTLASLAVALDHDNWPLIYVKWEVALLSELGFGLNFSECAATGQLDDLHFVSPKSGRAVSREAGQPYKDKLLPLPQFLIGKGEMDDVSYHQALRLTWYFFDRHMFAVRNKEMPDTRQRLLKIACEMLSTE
ncbi:DNA repair protein RecO [Curvivirga aplysinae]|uniref:DNA repair protein RecO n=1 Tax=Curvivirga aplysinae TaxID=2529852 RepID=UPI0012BBB388|nr:DNA repair protein RecO [Curvivirga aplysinae]MTI09802.1 DNA repair protein RecO [Curvivirga aplysinae]